MDWWGDNSQIAFAQHVCPNDALFELGTWFITYYLAGTQLPSGKAKFNLGFETFPVARQEVNATCDEVELGTPCITPELSSISK